MAEITKTTKPETQPTLVVREAFEKYRRGDRITDLDEIARIMASDYCANVVKVMA